MTESAQCMDLWATNPSLISLLLSSIKTWLELHSKVQALCDTQDVVGLCDALHFFYAQTLVLVPPLREKGLTLIIDHLEKSLGHLSVMSSSPWRVESVFKDLVLLEERGGLQSRDRVVGLIVRMNGHKELHHEIRLYLLKMSIIYDLPVLTGV